MKKCKQCDQEKSIDNFYKKIKKQDGTQSYDSTCKDCRIINKKIYQKTDKYKEYTKTYTNKNKENILKNAKKYYIKNKDTEKYKKTKSDYQKTEKSKATKKKWRESDKYIDYINTQKYKDYQKEYRKTDKYKDYQKKYNKTEKRIKAQKEYYQEHKKPLTIK